MNILYLAHRVPYPPNKGDKLRSFRQLEWLSRGHRIWCGCFADDPRDLAHAEALRRYCVDVRAIRLWPLVAAGRGLWSLLRGGTLTESYFARTAMHDVIERWVNDVPFDAVVAFSSSMAPYAVDLRVPRRVLDLCDVDSQKWRDYSRFVGGPRRWLYLLEAERLAERERAWLTTFDATMVVSEPEAALLRRDSADRAPWIVTNGVEVPQDFENRVDEDSPRCPTVGFIGVMDYFPNVDGVCWFVSECWPSIRAMSPDAVFRIVGRSPSRRVRGLGRAPGVEVVGEVMDVGEELQRMDVSVAPLRIARGVQNKVLEAMAWGKPVVLTSRAAGGLAARSRGEVVIADEPSEFAAQVGRLLRDPLKRSQLGTMGRALVAKYHRWPDALREFEFAVTGVKPPTADTDGMTPASPAAVPGEPTMASVG